MRKLRRVWKRVIGAIAGSRHEPELADEIEMHLQMQTEDNLKLGMSPQEAHRAAILKFGAIESAKERYREQRGLPALETWVKDAQYAFRSMRKNPEFAAASILSLALGMGATTAIFSVAYSVLLRPLPYSHPEHLATISVDGAIAAPLFETFRREARSVERAALFTSWYFNLAGQGEPERIPAARVSSELFEVLGVMPELGRTFAADEDQRGHENVVVISDGLWRRRFGGDANIIGRTVILNDAPYTLIGVMPPGFRFPEGPEHHSSVGPFPPAEMWRPMALLDWERTCKACFNFGMLARLQQGVNAKQATAELTAILRRLEAGKQADLPEVTVVNLQHAVTGKVRTPIMILLGAVTLALLIACVNVANLLLARGLRRREEIAVRLSLGATRARLVRQGFTEAFTLAICAACLALAVAWAGIRGLLSIAPAGIPRIETVAVDARMFGFALCLALVTAALFGIAPAMLTARSAPVEVMKMGGRTVTAASSRLRAMLVVAEFALSLVLLVGSGLLAKSFVTVSKIALGFQADHVLTMRMSLPETRYDERHRAMLIERLISNCSALPGVTSAAATSTLPLTGEAEGWGLLAEDNPNREAFTMTRVRAITPGYFRTLGIRVRAGREFNENDRGSNPVAIISETAARRLWPGVADPLGRRLLDKPPMTVIGIVDDTHASGIDAEVRPYLYLPFWQFAPPEFAIAVRSTSDPAFLVNAVKAEIRSIDKYQPVTDIAAMKQIVSESIASRRFPAILMAVFAAFALALASIGVYGVLSYSVARRIQEIGIRMALGSTRRRVVEEIVKQALALAVGGAAIGLLAAFYLTPLLRTLLFGVDAGDKSIFLGCAGLLLAASAAAGIIPARRAAKLDPAASLRCE